jgi:PBSX family phage terminase large subunit
LEKFSPHTTKQDTAIFSKKKIIINATGIQWGKTRTGAWRTKMAMHRFIHPEDSFIVAAPTYKIMQQATLPAFLQIMRGFGEYSKGDAVFRMHNGGTCYMRTATDPDSVVGITNCRHIWGDEAGLFPLYFHENLQARASFKKAPICYTTSPYSLNWIYTDYIRVIHKIHKKIARGAPLDEVEQQLLDDVELVQATSKENPYFPDDEYDRKKATMDPRRFNMVYGGEFNRIEGLVYDCFREETHIVAPETLPKGTYYMAGVDWGYTNPACIVVIAVTPDGSFIVVNEFYKTQQTIGEMVTAAKGLTRIYGIKRFYCDPSSPANIVEFNKEKLTAIPADNEIRAGIDSVYETIKDDKLRVFSGRAPNLLDELATYHYPSDPDINADKDIKEMLPVKQYEHSMDAMRYLIYSLKKSGLKTRQAVVPGMTPMDARLHAQDRAILRNLDAEYDW